ncbi:hypothetical protein [Methylobacterium sp. AMS5]|uniref:hypothetical protein n=1 Tax=Methylobacterium sp. AMS5 TaxID=925818 RepID=UPI00074FA9AC|nr:hypothetical protein [Methylobacterium sp. AMS5]AMB48300.1 hypothetical protein Y590_25365 [Methylobacterium sp. AMS5]
MTSINYSLEVTYERSEGSDGDIEEIAARFGYERGGSGSGGDTRDIDFDRDTPPTEEELLELKRAFRKLHYPVNAHVEEFRRLGENEFPDDNDDWEGKVWDIVDDLDDREQLRKESED